MRISLASHHDLAEFKRLIQSVPGHEIAWTACSGPEALSRCRLDPPDLLLLEIALPELGGAETTRRIMRDSPCAIVLTTTCVDSNAGKIFEAMGEGALDVIGLDLSEEGRAHSRAALLKKLRTVAQLQNSGRAAPKPAKPENPPQPARAEPPPLVVIGASTGGPKALGEVLAPLPAGLGAALVVVQHVDQEFSCGLAEWLDSHTPLRVQIAAAGDTPRAGQVYVAGSNDHLVLTRSLRFSYTPDPLSTPYRPSVDAFFKSVALHWPQPGMAILLTGMGRDGAEGLAALRGKGWYTVAQDQASSVVYGMPKAARELNAASEILPLKDIAPALLRWRGAGLPKTPA